MNGKIVCMNESVMMFCAMNYEMLDMMICLDCMNVVCYEWMLA